jgi:RNA polymerase-binding transcription factor DksA
MDPEQARGRLVEERERLQSLRDDFASDGLTAESEEASLGELSSLDQHQADVGTETFNRERDLSILENIEAELADVEHAIRRLDAMPAARFCLEDQAHAEREARTPGTAH